MAGLEQLEIHSKSYIVRWVKVEEKHTLSWSVQPNKKSINFGIFKHPGTNTSATQAHAPDEHRETLQQHDPSSHGDPSKRPSSSQNDSSTVQDELKRKGFIAIQWSGKCEADKVSMGTYAVPDGGGGMYGLVFDNTFSRALSKTATVVLLTYPSNAPPTTPHHMSMVQAVSGNVPSPKIHASDLANESVDSLTSDPSKNHRSRERSTSRNVSGTRFRDAENESMSPTYHVGILQKRRRKKGQGYARRFFSLDFASCTLSYYHSRNSSALRGAIPLSLAAIAADALRREICIDSGAEVWHLKAGNAREFGEWTRALQEASKTARGIEDDTLIPIATAPEGRGVGLQNVTGSQEENREWEQVEGLVSRIVGTRDAVRRLSADTASKRHCHVSLGISGLVPEQNSDYFGTMTEQKRSFWKRKSSQPVTPPTFQRSVAPQLAVPAPASVTNTTGTGASSPGTKHLSSLSHGDRDMYHHCSAWLNDLDAVLVDFAALLARSKKRRFPPLKADSRPSIDSFSTGEFYDAEDDPNHSLLITLDHHSDHDTQVSDAEHDSLADDDSTSSAGGADEPSLTDGAAEFPIKPKSLEPLPIETAPRRRTTIPPAVGQPPSLIAFLRKNVGKDLSTITMPVSANEPVSLLQRFAEQFEYAQLLDAAVSQKDPMQRLLRVTAFAVSQFSTQRSKERAIRKPFNPLLGETYELIRTNAEIPGGFRLLVEKISHRPVRIAMQADSAKWSLSFSPAPMQKFWGKSAEISTDGRVRIAMRLADGSDEFYSWNIATVFLRNVIMGEKYVEPVGNMSVVNESSGAKAAVEFKAKGMFGRRSEDVTVSTFDGNGMETSLGLVGTWTGGLSETEKDKTSREIWSVGDLVKDPCKRYGLTAFATGLNEITDVEAGKLPPTDTRHRRDQRMLEEGNLDGAESEKTRLEEAQRGRRKILEEERRAHVARWFVKVEGKQGGEEIWRLKSGKEGYWEERERGKWESVEDILA